MPRGSKLEERTILELRALAQRRGLTGAARLRKADLVAELESLERGNARRRATARRSATATARRGRGATARTRAQGTKKTAKRTTASSGRAGRSAPAATKRASSRPAKRTTSRTPARTARTTSTARTARAATTARSRSTTRTRTTTAARRGRSTGTGRAASGVRTGRQTSRSVLSAQVIRRVGERPERPGRTLVTTNHDVIRAWADARGAVPATVGTRRSGSPLRVLRLRFPRSRSKDLVEVSWDDWFATFDARNLNFIYQERRADGSPSSFFRLESPDREDG